MNTKFIHAGSIMRGFSFFLIKLLIPLLYTSLLCSHASAQTMTIKGSMQDTTRHKPLKSAVVMLIRLNDSLLIRFTRTDEQGIFNMDALPVDTYQVIISHPFFGDQTILIFGSKANNSFNLPGIILPPKSVTLAEVTILGYADPVYYKGDTLIYTADSFKVKQNAMVEDLLKKLPGIRVDAQGKIFSQGKAVDQVLVDGDEFFGTDPTAATRNLPANSVASVQVYDKKNDNATENTDKETLKVMDLKLKDDAKNGYFGKVSGATDFTNFYEGELLFNKFAGKQKISVFSLSSNTPRTAFDWNDTYQYGLSNEMNSYTTDDGMVYNFTNSNRPQGIPKTFKTGFYYTDQLDKKTKVTLNYTYTKASLLTQTSSSSQYFLPDTTYNTNDYNTVYKQEESHAINAAVTYTVDSLSELFVQSKFKTQNNDQNTTDNTTFLTSSDVPTRATNTENATNGNVMTWDNLVKFTRNFKKKDRKLIITYNLKITDANTTGILQWNTNNTLFQQLPDSSTNEKKTNTNNNQTQAGSITYTEPISKKIKLEFAYDLSISTGMQDINTKDFLNGSYDVNDSLYSNSFESTRYINRLGAKFIYESRNQTLFFGARVRQVDATNTNMETDSTLTQVVNNVLPYLNYRYKFNDMESMGFRYTTTSEQPSMNQLQPIPDNSNPNYIVKGNPDLLPTYRNSFDLDYYSYKPVSGRYVFAGGNFSTTNNAFSSAISYDSLGRTTTQPVNVQGNYNASIYSGAELPFYSRVLQLRPNANLSFSQNTNYINGEKNATQLTVPTVSLEAEVQPDTIIEFTAGGNYSYNYSSSSLTTASNKSYYSNGYRAGVDVNLPFKMRIETTANYYENHDRDQGYNLNYLIWNASLAKSFLKNENLTISLDATDLLNQNISTQRVVNDNIISDTKTNIIGRYILLKALFRFNSNKKKDDEEMF